MKSGKRKETRVELLEKQTMNGGWHKMRKKSVKAQRKVQAIVGKGTDNGA